MSGLLVTGAFVLSAMTVGLVGLDVLFTDVWPATDGEPWYVFALRAAVGTVGFVATCGIPGFVATAVSTTVLAILTVALAPVTVVALRYILRT